MKYSIFKFVSPRVVPISEGEMILAGNLDVGPLDSTSAAKIYGSYLQARAALINPTIHSICWTYFDGDVGDFAYDSFLDSLIFCGVEVFLTAVSEPASLLNIQFLGLPLSRTLQDHLASRLTPSEEGIFISLIENQISCGLLKIYASDVVLDGVAGFEPSDDDEDFRFDRAFEKVRALF